MDTLLSCKRYFLTPMHKIDIFLYVFFSESFAVSKKILLPYLPLFFRQYIMIWTSRAAAQRGYYHYYWSEPLPLRWRGSGLWLDFKKVHQVRTEMDIFLLRRLLTSLAHYHHRCKTAIQNDKNKLEKMGFAKTPHRKPPPTQSFSCLHAHSDSVV